MADSSTLQAQVDVLVGKAINTAKADIERSVNDVKLTQERQTAEVAKLDGEIAKLKAQAAELAGETGAELTRATGNPDYAECGTLLQGELMTVNDEVAATLAKVPEERRILVTDHDALGYLAEAYGYGPGWRDVPADLSDRAALERMTPTILAMSAHEGFPAHARAASIRQEGA